MKVQIPRVYGSKYLENKIQKVFTLLSSDIQKQVLENVTFVGSFNNAWAYTLKKEDIVGKYFIVIADELQAQSEEQIAKTIVHEIGHTINSHRNSIGQMQTKAEIKKQEKETEEFVRSVLYA